VSVQDLAAAKKAEAARVAKGFEGQTEGG